jgi:hypothetical protein
LNIWPFGFVSDFVFHFKQAMASGTTLSARKFFYGSGFQPRSGRGKMPLPQKKT